MMKNFMSAGVRTDFKGHDDCLSKKYKKFTEEYLLNLFDTAKFTYKTSNGEYFYETMPEVVDGFIATEIIANGYILIPNVVYACYLGVIYNKEQNNILQAEHALRMFEKQNLRCFNHQSMMLLARCYFILNHPVKAMNAYREALKLNSSSKTLQFHIQLTSYIANVTNPVEQIVLEPSVPTDQHDNYFITADSTVAKSIIKNDKSNNANALQSIIEAMDGLKASETELSKKVSKLEEQLMAILKARKAKMSSDTPTVDIVNQISFNKIPEISLEAFNICFNILFSGII